MTLFELLTSADIANVRLAIVLRDMFTAEEWARAVWSIYCSDCNYDSTSLWSKRTVIQVHGQHECTMYLNSLPVIEVILDYKHGLVFTALGVHQGPQAIIRAIEKAAYYETT